MLLCINLNFKYVINTQFIHINGTLQQLVMIRKIKVVKYKLFQAAYSKRLNIWYMMLIMENQIPLKFISMKNMSRSVPMCDVIIKGIEEMAYLCD